MLARGCKLYTVAGLLLGACSSETPAGSDEPETETVSEDGASNDEGAATAGVHESTTEAGADESASGGTGDEGATSTGPGESTTSASTTHGGGDGSTDSGDMDLMECPDGEHDCGDTCCPWVIEERGRGRAALALESQDHPHLASLYGGVYYDRYNGSTWVHEEVEDLAGGPTDVAIAIDETTCPTWCIRSVVYGVRTTMAARGRSM